MLIKEIKPIGKVGKSLLEDKNSDDIIDRIIELPMRKPCKIFKEKNIETNMSSANKNNLLKKGKKRIERENIKQDNKFHMFGPDFSYAGKGYAWIMLNYDKLSNENKEKIFELQEKRGQKTIWLVYSMYYTKFHTEESDYNDYKKKFDETTVAEVEEYFCEIANNMLQQ